MNTLFPAGSKICQLKLLQVKLKDLVECALKIPKCENFFGTDLKNFVLECLSLWLMSV